MSSKFSTKIRLIAMLTTLALSGCAITDKPMQTINAMIGKEKATTTYLSTSEILEKAPKSDWYSLNQDNLIYITLDNDQRIVMELNDKFAPEHGKQIRHLAKLHYWDDLTIYRVQDNYVAQFGSFDYASDTNTKPFPKDTQKLPAEFTIHASDIKPTLLSDKEPYSDKVGFYQGFPVAIKGKDAFLVHCYGMVGAARSNPPDSSQGSELYVMIGQPARHLDRQITVVGRVVHGIEHLSSLPRGLGNMGFYQDDQKPATIKSIRLGSQLPTSEQVQLESIRNDSKTFTDLIEARRHLQGEWFAAPVSGGMGVCDVRQTIRPIK